MRRVLIANRGEIALRIIRACRDLGIRSVLAYSEADSDSMPVRLADESICIGPAKAAASYLNISLLVATALLTECDAVHPGIGFLAENWLFAQMVRDNDLIFIGPSTDIIKIMGDKIAAKNFASTAGFDLIPGGEVGDFNGLAKFDYPILLKAAAGGGGRGIRKVEKAVDFPVQFDLVRNEALGSFNDDRIYWEKLLLNARHIEVQIFGDGAGNLFILGERDCSLQRRHQKLFEESPSPGLQQGERERLFAQVKKSFAQTNYQGPGTVEFLYDGKDFFFMEMNTRLQVEHTVTEETFGLDLVVNQIAVAYCEGVNFPKNPEPKGWAIQCRINAETSDTFEPKPYGSVGIYHPPGGPGVRVDSHMFSGYKLPSFYDNLLAKVIVKGRDRSNCLAILDRALQEFVITGVENNLDFFRKIMKESFVISGEYNIDTIKILSS